MRTSLTSRSRAATLRPELQPGAPPTPSASTLRRGMAVLSLATVALLLTGTAAALAGTCSLSAPLSTWGLGASGDWNTAGHWSPASVPNSSSQNVCIVDGTSTVTLDISASIASLQLASGNGLSFNPGVSLNLNGPQAINDGTITLNGGSGNNVFLNVSGNTMLSGTGTVQMNVADGGGSAFVEQSGGSFTLTNTGNTIQGAGVIGNGGLTFVNQATVNANASTQSLTLNGSGGVTNSSTLEATGGGILQLSTGVNNTGGTIKADGGTVINSASISGGTLTSTTVAGTVLETSGTGALSNVTISSGSTYATPNGSTTNISGSIVNQGSLTVAGGAGNNGFLQITNNTTLSGGGTVQLSTAAGGGDAFIQQSGGSFTLTNSDNTIEGGGIIGNGGITLVNNATVNANASGQALLLDGSPVTNTHLLEATNSGTLNLDTAITNTGGTISASGGGTVNNFGTITGGTLSGGGTLQTASGQTATLSNVTIGTGSTYATPNGSATNINGAIVNQGTLAVAGGAGNNGALLVNGATTLSGGGTVQLTTAPGGGDAFIEQSGGSFTLTNSDNTIEGTGIIGNGGLTFINNATVNATSSTQALTLNGSGGVTNNSLLEASSGGTLNIETGITNTGASITANSGGTVNNFSTITGGTLSGGGTFQTSGTATLSNVTISSGTTYATPNGTSTNINGAMVNQGALTVAGGAGNNGALLVNGNTTLSGGGSVQLSTASGGGDAFIEQSGGSFTLTNSNNTLEGAGVIGNGGLTLVNQVSGTVNANAAGQTLLLNGSGNVQNQGLLEATNTGTLQINNVVNNAGANITANNGTVLLAGATIQAGSLNTASGGTIETAAGSNATLDGRSVIDGGQGTLTNNGNYVGALGSATNIEGTIANPGSITINGGAGQNTVLQIVGNTTLSGTGTVQMNVAAGGGNAIIQQSGGSFTLTNGGNTIQGAGVIGNGGLTFVNTATVDANASGQTLALNGSGGVTNTATLEATGGGTLNIQTGITNTGGTITANGGTVNNFNSITGGTLTSTGASTFQSVGTGTLTNVTISAGSTYTTTTGNTTNINGAIVNQGTLALDGGAGNNGILQITSDTTLSGGGTLQMTVNPTGGGNDFIQQSGGSFTLTNTDNTIEGTGVIGNGGLTLVNNATVNANASGQALTLNGSGGVTNAATLEATGGGTLNIQTGINNAGGTITANGGTVNNFNSITGGTLTSTGSSTFQSVGTGTLTNVTISTGSTYTTPTGNTTDINGAIVNQGTLALAGGAGNNGILQVTSNTTLSGGGTVQMSVASGGGNAFIQQSGGSFTLTNTDNTIEGAGVLGNGGLTFVNQAAGTVNSNAGSTLTLNGSGGVTNDGTFIASNGSTLSVTAPLTNFSGGTLTGGTYESISTGAGATLSLANGPIVTDAANILLSGAGSTFTANGTALDSSLTTIAAGGTFTITNGRNFTVPTGGLSNSGTVNVGAATGASSTLTAPQGINGTTGTLQINPTGNVVLGANSTTGFLFHDGSAAGSLALGSNNITVSSDYNNANFGVGNAFNNHANVSGSGLILAAGNVGMTVTGAGITGGSTPMLDLGSVHVGSSGSGTFDVNNTGTTGPVLRGAVQTTGLSNPAFGLTAQNFGPIALGGSTAINYTFNPTVAGSLSGQSFSVVSNFDNVAPVTVGVIGAAYALASPTVGSSLSPGFNFGVVQVGQTYTDNLTITNTLVASSAAFQEGLNASFGTPTNSQLTTNGGTVTNLAAGTSNSTAMSVTLAPTRAGTIGGVVPINFASNGVTTSGLGITPLAGQNLNYTWTLSATVINQANPSITPTTIDFGNVRINTTQQQALSVTNIAGTPPQASLDAQISAVGPATSNGGMINQLAPGGTDSTSLIAGLSTASAGVHSGTATVALQSDSTPEGCTSDCIVNLTSQSINVKGTVYRLANPVLNTASVTLAARVGGTTPSQALSITNSSPDQYTEALKASFGAVSSPFSGSGMISGLAAQGTDASSLTLGLSTTTSGTFTGTAAVNFTSTGTGTDDAPDLSLTAGSVNLTGKVYQTAVAAVTNSVNFGIVHVGDVVSNQAVTVSNIASGALVDVITGGFTAPPPGSPFVASGTLGAGVAAGTSSNALQVGLNTSTSGVFNATANLALNSHDPDLADVALTAGPVSLTAQVNNYAVAAFAKTGGNGAFSSIGSNYTLNLGTLTQDGASQNATLDVLNGATGLSDLLDGSFTVSSGGGEFGLGGYDDFTDFAAGQSEALSVMFDPTSTGLFEEVIDLAGIGHNASGYSESLPATLTLEARVTSSVPTPEPGTLAILGTALAGLAGVRRRRAAMRIRARGE